MQTIPSDKVIVHIVSSVSEFRARREAARLPKAAEERPVVLSSIRETLGVQGGPSMREALGLAA